MTTPAPTITVLPASATLTSAAPRATLTATDTASPYSPVATSKQWKLGGAAVPGATNIGTSQTLYAQRAGVHAVTLTVDNGTQGTSAGTNVTITDSVATTAAAQAVGGVIPPVYLPFEYLDPTIATPGLPTAGDLYSARTYGTVAPTSAGVVAT